jgi:serine/threonine protein kinase
MVHQVLRERSIMSSIVTSNARYRTTLISISDIDLSLLISFIQSPFLDTILHIPICLQVPASTSIIQALHFRAFSDTYSPHCTLLYINILVFFIHVVYVVRISEMFVRMFSAFQSRQSLYIAMEFVQGGDCLSMLTTMIRCCAMMCCAVLCCAVLCCAVLCCAVLCCAVLCCAVLCCAVLCCPVLCCAVLCCAVLCCVMTNTFF